MSLNSDALPATPTASLQEFEALFNFASIGIVVTNNDGRISNFNKYAEAKFGYTREEILGKRVEVLLPQSSHHRHEDYRHQYYQHPEPRVMGHGRDLYAQSKDGNTFPVEVSLSHYKHNNQTFVIAFVIDITVRKGQELIVIQQKTELEKITLEIKKMNSELEQTVEDRTKMLREALRELEKSKEELNEAFENEKGLSELKSGFVTLASHEFRTPLSTILSSAYLIEKYNEDNLNPKIEKHVKRIKNAVGGMKNILEDFLSLGKLEEGLVQSNLELFATADFCEFIESVISELEPLKKGGQDIIVENVINKNVWIDHYLLKNIVINLLSNAIKFSNENGKIKLITFVENDHLVLIVQDDGIGISEEDQQHLFQRFFRAKNAANIQGTGLGLHIVVKYLELLDGRIKMNSALNEGTTFNIYFPQPKS